MYRACLAYYANDDEGAEQATDKSLDSFFRREIDELSPTIDHTDLIGTHIIQDNCACRSNPPNLALVNCHHRATGANSNQNHEMSLNEKPDLISNVTHFEREHKGQESDGVQTKEDGGLVPQNVLDRRTVGKIQLIGEIPEENERCTGQEYVPEDVQGYFDWLLPDIVSFEVNDLSEDSNLNGVDEQSAVKMTHQVNQHERSENAKPGFDSGDHILLDCMLLGFRRLLGFTIFDLAVDL